MISARGVLKERGFRSKFFHPQMVLCGHPRWYHQQWDQTQMHVQTPFRLHLARGKPTRTVAAIELLDSFMSSSPRVVRRVGAISSGSGSHASSRFSELISISTSALFPVFTVRFSSEIQPPSVTYHPSIPPIHPFHAPIHKTHARQLSSFLLLPHLPVSRPCIPIPIPPPTSTSTSTSTSTPTPHTHSLRRLLPQDLGTSHKPRPTRIVSYRPRLIPLVTPPRMYKRNPTPPFTSPPPPRFPSSQKPPHIKHKTTKQSPPRTLPSPPPPHDNRPSKKKKRCTYNPPAHPPNPLTYSACTAVMRSRFSMSARCAFSRASCAPRCAYCRLRLWLCDEAVEVDAGGNAEEMEAVAGWVERREGWDIVEMEETEEMRNECVRKVNIHRWCHVTTSWTYDGGLGTLSQRQRKQAIYHPSIPQSLRLRLVPVWSTSRRLRPVPTTLRSDPSHRANTYNNGQYPKRNYTFKMPFPASE